MRTFLHGPFSSEGEPKTRYFSVHSEGFKSSAGIKFCHAPSGIFPYGLYCLRFVLHSEMVILPVDNVSHFLLRFAFKLWRQPVLVYCKITC